jgi:hypothetical protein
MKTILLALLVTVLFSCQEDFSPNDPRHPVNIRNNNGTGGIETNNADDADGTTNAPIDGGLTVLLIAGAVYGAKRYRNTRRKTE